MPEKKTIKRAQKAKHEGKSASSQAGEFVHEQIEHIRKGKHGAKSAKQAIAIGLSQARRSGVEIPKKAGGKTSGKTHHIHEPKTSAKRSKAAEKRLQKESGKAASHNVLSLQAKRVAKKRTAKERHDIAMKAARTRAQNKKAA